MCLIYPHAMDNETLLPPETRLTKGGQTNLIYFRHAHGAAEVHRSVAPPYPIGLGVVVAKHLITTKNAQDFRAKGIGMKISFYCCTCRLWPWHDFDIDHETR